MTEIEVINELNDMLTDLTTVKKGLEAAEYVIEENKQLREENSRLKNTVIFLGNRIKEKKEIWDYFEKRFVKVSDCTSDKKALCPMFPDRCEGENCMEWLDLVDLLDKASGNDGVK